MDRRVLKSSHSTIMASLGDIVMFSREPTGVLLTSAVRLMVAAILGGLVGLERQLKRRSAGLRTNMLMCIGAAMFTILSGLLSEGGDHTRIAAQIITGIGFIGAGSILHPKGELVAGLTTAATLFVVASIGMAAGGGFFLTATFATVIVLLALFSLGRVENRLNLTSSRFVYEITGQAGEEDLQCEVNHILEPAHQFPENWRSVRTPQHLRAQFELRGTFRDHQDVLNALRRSALFQSVSVLSRIGEQE